MKVRLDHFISQETKIQTILALKKVLGMSIGEATLLVEEVKTNSHLGLWVEKESIDELKKRGWFIHYSTPEEVVKLEEFHKAELQFLERLKIAEDWYNGLKPEEKEFVDVIAESRQLGPAMG